MTSTGTGHNDMIIMCVFVPKICMFCIKLYLPLFLVERDGIRKKTLTIRNILLSQYLLSQYANCLNDHHIKQLPCSLSPRTISGI